VATTTTRLDPALEARLKARGFVGGVYLWEATRPVFQVANLEAAVFKGRRLWLSPIGLSPISLEVRELVLPVDGDAEGEDEDPSWYLVGCAHQEGKIIGRLRVAVIVAQDGYFGPIYMQLVDVESPGDPNEALLVSSGGRNWRKSLD